MPGRIMAVLTAALLLLSVGSTCLGAGREANGAAVATGALFEDELAAAAYTTHMAQDRHDEALKVAEEAVRVRPQNYVWRRRAATAAEMAGKRQRALAHLLYLAESGDGTARLSGLRLARSMDEYPVRRYLLEGLLLSGSEDPELLKEYVAVSEQLGISHEAYDLLAPKLSSGSRELLLQEQARLAEQLGRASEAVNALNRLALIRPLTPEETIRRARLMHGQGDLVKVWQTGQEPVSAPDTGRQPPPAVAPPPSAPATAPEAAAEPDAPRRSYVWTSSVPRTDERRYFLIEPPKVAAMIKYDYNQEDRIVAGQRSTNSAHTVTERLDLVTSGFVYHPALLQYNLKFSPEFRQTTLTRSELGSGTATEGSGFSPNYYANTVLLSQKPYSMSLFAQRTENQTWSTYTGVSKTSTESYGGDINLKYSLMPTTVGGSVSKSEQIGFYNTSSDWQEVHLYSRHRGVTGETGLTANYSISSQVSNSTPNDIKTLNAGLSNKYEFTSDGRIALASNLQYMDQRSSLMKNTSLQVNESLSWEHDKQLRSRYTASYRRSEAPQTDSDWLSLDGRVTHQLYENLTTTAGVTGTANNSTGTRERSLAGMLNSVYQRRLSTWGNLGLQAGWNYLYTTRSGMRGASQELNEPHTLNILVETYLAQPSVVPGSVRVTNSSGTVVYVQDLDYRLDLIGNLTRISRLPLGAIGEGQLVLVTYSYSRDAGYDDAVLTQNYGFNLDFWRSLYLSYRYLQAQQYLMAGPPPSRTSSAVVHLMSLRYLLGWTETGASYEDNRGADISYTRWEVSEAVRARYGNWLQFNLRGYYGVTEYRSHQDQRTTYGGTTNLNWLPYTWMRFELEGYLEQIDGDIEKSTNSGARALLEMQYRLWTLRFGYKMSEQDNRMSRYTRTSQLMQMELSRALW